MGVKKYAYYKDMQSQLIYGEIVSFSFIMKFCFRDTDDDSIKFDAFVFDLKNLSRQKNETYLQSDKQSLLA